MRYHQHLDYRRKKRIHRRRKVFATIIILLAIGIAVYFAIENFKAENFNSEEQTTSAATSSYIAPNIQVFLSPYFQFQTNRSWSEDPGSSAGNRYTYRSMRGNLLEHTLIIYVNSAPDDIKVTRVLVSTMNGNRGLKAEKISDHCGKSNKSVKSGLNTVLDQVTFKCFPDDTRFNVLVGMFGGTTNITLPRPDGSTAVYTIYYSNVTVTPDASQITDIVNSFQTR